MELSNKELGNYLKTIREQLGYTIYDVNKLCEISPSYISLMENGKRRPSPIILKKLSSIYHINCNDLYEKAGYDELIEDNKKDLIKNRNVLLYKKIKEARLEKKITQKDLANELTRRGRKTSNTAIANWEAGLNSPDVDTVQLMCEILEKDGNYFFDVNSNFRYAEYNGLNTEGLTDEDIEDIKAYIEMRRNINKNKNKQ